MSSIPSQSLHGSYLMPRLEHATVSDAMHPGILFCEPDATFTDVARLMASHHVHCVAVMASSHEAADEKLVWRIVTDVDLLRAGLRGVVDGTAGTIAAEVPISVEPTTPLREAGELMLSHGSKHLVVINRQQRRPIGILSTLDLPGVLAWGEA